MKLIKAIFISSALIVGGLQANAQGTFQNLDFESAAPSTPIKGPDGPYYQPVSLALPGWTVSLGTVQQSQVLQNTYTEGQAAIVLFGPNYPAAGASPGLTPGTLDGNYSVLLQSGLSPEDNTSLVSASIAQTGMVPPGAQFMEFKAWQTDFTEFTVSFQGTSLLPVAFGTGPNYTSYIVNISPYDGQSGQLEFTADFSGTGASWLGLDDITFTDVPEPSPLLLTGIGGLLFEVRRRYLAKSKSSSKICGLRKRSKIN